MKKSITKVGGKLVYLPVDDLQIHPKNLRRFIRASQAKEMADSIKHSKGVYQALLIVPNGTPGKFYVCDGNIRLAGARLLGKECPRLKCEIFPASAAEQLLAMAVTSRVRFSPDAISEALHYERLMKEERFTTHGIAEATGIHIVTIQNRLHLLELDEGIQNLIGEGRFPSDRRAADALLSVPDAKARVKVAERLARDGATIKVIVKACERLKTQLEAQHSPAAEGAPSLALARGKKATAVASTAKVPWAGVRAAAGQMCEACDIRLNALKGHPAEPAWSLISHAATETCRSCSVRDLRSACGECPGVDILRRLIALAGRGQ